MASSLNNLAALYQNQGRYEEAEPLFQQSLQLYQRLLGSEHFHFSTSLSSIARLYYLQDRYEEAERSYRQSVALDQKLLGSEYPNLAFNWFGLAKVCESLGRSEEAESVYIEALRIRNKKLGPDHPKTQEVMESYQHFLRHLAEAGGSALSTLQNEGSEMTRQILNQMLRPEEST